MASRRTKAGAGPKQSHSVRVHDDVWAKAKRRAELEGTTVNGVVEEILEGYGAGLINLPKITKTYT
jgi:hypothetical protein